MRSSFAFLMLFWVMFSIDLCCHLLSFRKSCSLFLKIINQDTDFWSCKFCSFQELDRRATNYILHEKPCEPSLESHFSYAEAVHSFENSVLILFPIVFDTNDSSYIFAAHFYVDIKKSQIPFLVNFFNGKL